MVRFRNRYLVMEIFLDPNKDLANDEPIIVTTHNVSKAIKDSVHTNFGECGAAAIAGSFQVLYVNPITKLCIIRVSREEHEKLWAATTLVRSIGNCPVMFNLLDLSDVSVRAQCHWYEVASSNLGKREKLKKESVTLVRKGGSSRTCKVAALNCDETKFEQYKQLIGDKLTQDTTQKMQNFLEKIKLLN